MRLRICSAAENEESETADSLPPSPGETHRGAILAARYLVEANLGAGRVAQALRARDLETGRSVAVKLAAGENRRERRRHERALLREHLILSRSPHRAFPEALDAGRTTSGDLFTVQELLGAPVRVEDLDETLAARLVVELLFALDHLHRHRYAHGDLRPDHFRVAAEADASGTRVVLMDLSHAAPLGRPIGGRGRAHIGTVGYAPPEYWRNGLATPEADLYSLGVCLLELALPVHAPRDAAIFPSQAPGQGAATDESCPSDPAARLPGWWVTWASSLASFAVADRPGSALDALQRLAGAIHPGDASLAWLSGWIATEIARGREREREREPAAVLPLGRWFREHAGGGGIGLGAACPGCSPGAGIGACLRRYRRGKVAEAFEQTPRSTMCHAGLVWIHGEHAAVAAAAGAAALGVLVLGAEPRRIRLTDPGEALRVTAALLEPSATEAPAVVLVECAEPPAGRLEGVEEASLLGAVDLLFIEVRAALSSGGPQSAGTCPPPLPPRTAPAARAVTPMMAARAVIALRRAGRARDARQRANEAVQRWPELGPVAAETSVRLALDDNDVETARAEYRLLLESRAEARALDSLPVMRLLRLAELGRELHELDSARALLSQAAALAAARAGPTSQLARIATETARCALAGGQPAEALQVIATEWAGRHDAELACPGVVAELLRTEAVALRHLGRGQEAAQRIAAADECLPHRPAYCGQRAAIDNLRALLCYEGGHLAAATAAFSRAITAAGAAAMGRRRDRISHERMRANLAMTLLLRGELAQARAHLETAVRRSFALGDAELQAAVLHNWGLLAHARGNHDDALRRIREAATRWESAGNPYQSCLSRLGYCTVLIAIGDYRAARPRLERLREDAARLGRPQLVAAVAVASAEAALGDGDEIEVVRWTTRAESVLRATLPVNERRLAVVERLRGSASRSLRAARSHFRMSRKWLRSVDSTLEEGLTLMAWAQRELREWCSPARARLLAARAARCLRVSESWKSAQTCEEYCMEIDNRLAGRHLPAARRHLVALVEIGQRINELTSLAELFSVVLDVAITAVGGERGLLLLAIPEQPNSFDIASVRHIDPARVEEATAISSSAVAQILSEGKPLIVRDTAADPAFASRHSVSVYGIQSLLCVPLRLRDRTIGAVYVDILTRERAFEDDDLTFLTSFAQQAALALDNARFRQRLLDENQRLRDEARQDLMFSEIIAASSPMQDLFKTMRRIKDSSTTVFIGGESGTGKELIARALHYNSDRRDGPFVAVALGAVAETIIESELFGHVRGAFTGAHADRVGLALQADKGTLFLDEIADVSPAMQVKILRFLEQREIRPVGSPTTRHVDVRVISATNKDLRTEVDSGRFREDLFYRLYVMPLQAPPLRERRGDVPLLATHFLRKMIKRMGRIIPGFSEEAMRRLEAYHWPGNVRELQNVVERAIHLTDDGEIVSVEQLPSEVRGKTLAVSGFPATDAGGSLQEAMDRFERKAVLETLDRCGWHRARTADALGVTRQALVKKMHRLAISEECDRA
ncbi:MAG: sigma 54-interacting transcriptional regulator [Candidatus Schekmanbacteria bacterium]|nr:sigma 54-interacting transcriptional regulator [Candidatus Schekmanbacteria bacterium]